MGRTSIAAVVTGALALLATVGLAHAEMYVVQVRRIDQDLHKPERVYIQARYCYRYAYGDAVLKYPQYSYDNKLIFDDGEVCEALKVFR